MLYLKVLRKELVSECEKHSPTDLFSDHFSPLKYKIQTAPMIIPISNIK